jgi:hypothetical protein
LPSDTTTAVVPRAALAAFLVILKVAAFWSTIEPEAS